jgi:hypothetical protein
MPTNITTWMKSSRLKKSGALLFVSIVDHYVTA